jgi:hypothetical protein
MKRVVLSQYTAAVRLHVKVRRPWEQLQWNRWAKWKLICTLGLKGDRWRYLSSQTLVLAARNTAARWSLSEIRVKTSALRTKCSAWCGPAGDRKAMLTTVKAMTVRLELRTEETHTNFKHHSFIHPWLCSPCRDLGCLTPEVFNVRSLTDLTDLSTL